MVFRIFLITILIFSAKARHKIQEDPEVVEKLYMKLFKTKRAEQFRALKSLGELPYDKRQSMVHLMTEKIFGIVQDSRAIIEASSYVPGISEFPTDPKVRDALSSILENTALFSEYILRYPEVGSSVLKTNNNWDVLLQWSIAFSNQVKYLLDPVTVKLLSIASQQLGYIDKEEGFENPFHNVREAEIEEVKKKKGNGNRKRKKAMRKGPKLHTIEL